MLLVECGQISMAVGFITMFADLSGHHFWYTSLPQVVRIKSQCFLLFVGTSMFQPHLAVAHCQGISSYNHGTLRTFALLDLNSRAAVEMPSLNGLLMGNFLYIELLRRKYGNITFGNLEIWKSHVCHW